ncbi:MAG: hypothetical protein KGZ68_07495 [Dechloromonas sp.]|nr:hypothetical protein [Dechloromonas sp.]
MNDERLSESEIAPPREGQWGLHYFAQAILAIAVSLLAIYIYHTFIVTPNKTRLAVIDIGEVMDIKQLQLTKAAMAKDIDDSGRAKLYDEVTTFSAEVENAISTIQNECGCTLIVRAAIVKGDAPDLTEQLKAKLGMAGVNPVSLAKTLSTVKSVEKTHE